MSLDAFTFFELSFSQLRGPSAIPRSYPDVWVSFRRLPMVLVEYFLFLQKPPEEMSNSLFNDNADDLHNFLRNKSSKDNLSRLDLDVTFLLFLSDAIEERR